MAREPKPMLENRKPEEKKPTLGLVEDEAPKTLEAPPRKEDTRVLSEVESLRVEVVNLGQQNMNLEERLMKVQTALLDAQRINLQLRQANFKQSTEKVFDDLGLTGERVTLNKNKDGRYEVKTEVAP
jgi:hypothetical protein